MIDSRSKAASKVRSIRALNLQEKPFLYCLGNTKDLLLIVHLKQLKKREASEN